MFSQKKGTATAPSEIDLTKIPHHIAIIMDGNGRWAQARHLPRVAGHQQGMETVKKVTIAASNLGVKVLTLYAFSTENWKRPQSEVSFLMNLPIKFFNKFVPDLVKHNVRVDVMGNISKLPDRTQIAVQDAIRETAHCSGMILNFALNYGGRDEIVHATTAIVKEVQAGELSSDEITEDTFSKHLMTSQLIPDDNPELLIRTSGEQRLSNFMLWQVAYSEFVFMDEHWPDFDGDSLKRAISIFQHRHRRFGGLKNK
ncbi:isoprenyl transferase [uncultured Limosilactobacillus sp.]|uniref:isoprenyl transferase n=1 Tax=uncultured Limosilactobacillus sp. TaxID=2837629 RepID=UPI0025ECC30B|nr:isoprenyl transferase [uncultured Limosilactobacillus sp.]